MATTLHTPFRFHRPEAPTNGRRLARSPLDLLAIGATTLLTVPWLVLASRLTTAELDGLFGVEGAPASHAEARGADLIRLSSRSGCSSAAAPAPGAVFVFR